MHLSEWSTADLKAELDARERTAQVRLHAELTAAADAAACLATRIALLDGDDELGFASQRYEVWCLASDLREVADTLESPDA